MEFKKVLEKRQTIRRFKNKNIPEETIREILELANLAPSAGNLQAFKIIIIKNDEIKKRIPEFTFSSQDFIAEAPVVFIIFADLGVSAARFNERGRDLYAIQDATIFASYLQLAAASKKLTTVWVGSFDEKKVQKFFQTPKNLKPVVIMPCGYPKIEAPKTKRKKMEELILTREHD